MSIEAFTEEEVKSIAKKLLQDTDYAVLTDVSDNISNIEDIKQYRTNIRQVYLNPSEYYNFDAAPEPDWTQPEETPGE